jgi:hypothetical protein
MKASHPVGIYQIVYQLLGIGSSQFILLTNIQSFLSFSFKNQVHSFFSFISSRQYHFKDILALVLL